jgi:p24 family protein beta-1
MACLLLANHEPLTKELWALSDGLSAIFDEQNYMVHREVQHHESKKLYSQKFIFPFVLVAASTNSRIVWWSIFESIILVCVCLFQVQYLKR